jgi:hypothetical protein
LWNRLPGHWIVRVSEANGDGLAFWEATIGEYTQGAFERAEHSGKQQLFRVFSFRSGVESAAV